MSLQLNHLTGFGVGNAGQPGVRLSWRWAYWDSGVVSSYESTVPPEYDIPDGETADVFVQVMMVSSNVSTVIVDGVVASKIASNPSSGGPDLIRFHVFAVPAASKIGKVVVTASGTAQSCAFVVYTMKNNDGIAPSDVALSDTHVASVINLNVNAPKGGVIMAMVGTHAGGNATWSAGMTEIFDVSLPSTSFRVSAAYNEDLEKLFTGGTQTVEAAQSSVPSAYAGGLSASWGPE